jgi:hypothetical protein
MDVNLKEQETIRKHVEFKRLLAENGFGKLIKRIEHMEATYDACVASDYYKIPAYKTEVENGVGNMLRSFYGEGEIN